MRLCTFLEKTKKVIKVSETRDLMVRDGHKIRSLYLVTHGTVGGCTV